MKENYIIAFQLVRYGCGRTGIAGTNAEGGELALCQECRSKRGDLLCGHPRQALRYAVGGVAYCAECNGQHPDR